MASQGRNEAEQLRDQTSSVQHRTRSTYDMLIRQSRKLGRHAMQTMTDAKQGARQLLGQRSGAATVDVDDIEELKKVIEHSHEMIVEAKTVLPPLFKNEIMLDRTKITIIKRNSFWSSEVISIRIEDVLNVSAAFGPILGSVTIASRVMSSVDHFEVTNFWRDDAMKLKQIIQGYLIARQNGVSTDHLSCEELAKTLYEIGLKK